jgi:hypothetical protein
MWKMDREIEKMNEDNLDISFLNSFNKLVLNNNTSQRNLLMIKMRAINDTYGGMFEELYSVIEEIILLYGDDIFGHLKLKDIIYGMIDYYSTDYMNYINNFIKFMIENVPNDMKLSDILYCIQNY